MLVLVEDAAEAVAPSYVEAGYLVRICDRDGQWAHRAGVGDALVRSMGVVELLELVQRVQQVPLVPDQGRSSSSRRQVCTHLSMIEFILGI